MASTTVAGIPELLHHIIEFSDRQGLARLARVSACFHSIAIAHLWSVKDLVGLLGLLPEGILGQRDPPMRKWRLEIMPQGSDLDRFHHYSVYTTSLTVSTKDCPGQLITFLADKSRTFFPRLRDLVIIAANRQYPAAECILLGGEGLRKLEVNRGRDHFGPVSGTVPYDAHLTEAFFRNIINHTPNLTQFKIGDFLVSSTDSLAFVIDIFCLALRTLSSLQKFHWGMGCTLPSPVLTAIAAHPSISNLNLDHLSFWPTLDRNTLFFPSLKVVRLVCRKEVGDAFVRTIAYPHLLSGLDLILSDYGGDPPISFFQSFSRLFSMSLGLTSLRLSPGGPMVWAQLSPILNCRLLVSLVVHTFEPLEGLSDKAIRDLASSLSHLEVLELQSTTRDRSLIEVTLLGLTPLAHHIPRLLNLSIAVTTRVPDPSTVDALLQFHPTTPRSLQQLHLCTSDINIEDDTPEYLGARRTASVVSLLWPLLPSDKVNQGWGAQEGAISLTWLGVTQHLEQRECNGKPIPFV